MPRGKSRTLRNCHVTKTMPLQRFIGVRDLFQTKNIYRDVFQTFFFCRDENQNLPKLQIRKSYLSQNFIKSCIWYISLAMHLFCHAHQKMKLYSIIYIPNVLVCLLDILFNYHGPLLNLTEVFFKINRLHSYQLYYIQNRIS